MGDLIAKVTSHLKTTMYHLFDVKNQGEKSTFVNLLCYEIDKLYIEDISVEYQLTAEEYCIFHDTIIDLVTSQYCILSSQPYRGEGKELYHLHAVVFTDAQTGPTVHHCTRMSVLAGCGNVTWDGYDGVQKMDVVDFVYNLIDRVGLAHDEAKIITSDTRYVAEFDLREMSAV